MISQKSDHAAFSCYELTKHIYYALYTIHFPYHIRGAAASCRRRACAPNWGITGILSSHRRRRLKSLLWAYFLTAWNFLVL